MNDYWNSIIKINSESYSLISKILDENLGKKFRPFSVEFFILNIFRRLVFVQKGIDPLLVEIIKNKNLEFSIGILLRSACLDILQFGHIHKCIDEINVNTNTPFCESTENNAQLVSELKKIYSSNICSQLEDQKALRDIGIISDSEYEKTLDLFNENFSWLHSSDNGFDNSLPTRKLFKSLRESRKYDLYSYVFIEYSYYSKLEHFGILSCVFTTKFHYENDEVFHRIIRLLTTFLKVYQVGLVFMMKDQKYIDKLDEYIDFIKASK